MKRIVALLLSLTTAAFLCACGSSEPVEPSPAEETAAPANCTGNDLVSIDAVCVDDSYRDKDNSPLRMVHLFYTVHPGETNMEVDSKGIVMTINENNQYTGGHYPDACDYATSYYYSSWLKSVYMGSSIKVATTFLVPEADLAPGRSITLSEPGVPEIDFRFTTDDIQHFENAVALAEAIDPEGYAEAMYAREPAEASVVSEVKSRFYNHYWWAVVNGGIKFHIEFFSNDTYELKTTVGGTSNTTYGTYTVANSYIICTNDSTGAVTEIPYNFDNEIFTLDLAAGFDVTES